VAVLSEEKPELFFPVRCFIISGTAEISPAGRLLFTGGCGLKMQIRVLRHSGLHCHVRHLQEKPEAE
jgi:hypothetical protein